MKRAYCLLAFAQLGCGLSVYDNTTVSDSILGSSTANFSGPSTPQPFSTSRTATTTGEAHVGNYVAAGLGIEADTSQSSSSSSSVPSTVQSTSFASQSTSIGPAANSSLLTRTTVASTPFTTGGNSTVAPSTVEEGYPDATGVITVNINYSGDCWNRWNQFWNTSSTVSAFGLAVTKPRATATGLITSYRRDNLTLYGPSCTLPSIVPSCASSWSSYQEGSIREAPPCSQASIGEKACNSVREDYLWNVKGVVMNPFFTNPGYLPNGSWPTHSSLAPSCTLGCAGCAITGNSVELLFWPEQTAAPTANGTGWQNNTASSTTSDRGPVTAVVGTYTFTSPTVYISYDTLYAANSCGPIGDVYNNTILPLANTNHLSSLMLTAQNPGLFGPVYTYYYSASFNLSDLVEPVPQSVYNQAPACQSQSYKNCKVGGGPCGFVCATDKPYAPIIAVPIELTDLHPEWKSCTPWYGGLYDPPIALTQAPTADVITPPGVGASPTTTPAAEAPPIQGMPPSVTAGPVQEPTTKAPAQPSPTPDTEPESPRPPQNGSPGSSGPEGPQPGNGDQPSNESPSNGPTKDNQASNGQPEHDSNPSSPNNSSNDPGSSEPGPDRPDLPVVITQPTQSDGFIFSPEQSPDPPVNHGSPTNALEVLTQALDPGVGNDADSPATPNPSITPPPGNVVLSPPDIPVSRSGSDYFVGTNQLPPGSATTVYGVEVSNDPNADDVIIADSTTLSLAANEATTLSAWSHGAERLTITRQDNEHIVVAEHTLTQGEFATFRDVSVSVGPEGQVVVLGSTALSLEDGGYTTLPNPNPTAVGPEILRGSEAYVVAGVSVHAGEVVTINDVAVSIGSGGEVQVDGKTTMILGMGETTALPFWTASGHQGTRGEGVTVVKNGMTFVNGEVSVAATGTDTSMASRASRKTDDMPQPGSATRAVDDEAPTATETGAAAALMAVTSGHLLAVCGLLAMML